MDRHYAIERWLATGNVESLNQSIQAYLIQRQTVKELKAISK